MYRYRWNGATVGAEKRFDTILSKLGKIRYVKGYRYYGRYNVNHEAVLIRGENGSARFHGLLWGYHGQGPRALVELLVKLGFDKRFSQDFAFTTPRLDKRGMDWKLNLEAIPDTFEVQPLGLNEEAKDRVTCGNCGLSWDDGINTGITPAPAARCPFEWFHDSLLGTP